MLDSGVINWWDRRSAGSERCVKEGLNPPRSGLSRLNLANLQGPFTILIVGYVLATVAWFRELFFSYYSRRTKNIWKAQKRANNDIVA